MASKPIIDILIGVNYANLYCTEMEIKGESNEPAARLTPLMWIYVGGINEPVLSTNFVIDNNQDLVSINNTIRKLWELEGDNHLDGHRALSPADTEALQIVNKSLTNKDGKYELRIPWKKDEQLDNNYSMALNRLANTEKRSLKNTDFGKKYNEIVAQYLEKGYLERVDKEDTKDGWFVLHFPVLRPDKSTTEVRIVFDGSAKLNGKSLNDVIHQGPKLQQDLVKVLLRFRRHPVALFCDIAEMYLRIGIHPDDQKYQRILWRNLDPTSKPDIFQFNRMAFGIDSSPFAAQFVSRKHAKKDAEIFPMGSSAVLESTHMDGTMDSVTDDKTGIKYHELSKLWQSAGMYVRKSLSNSTKVFKIIPEADHAENIDLDSGELPSIKTLGIVWNAKDYVFTYKSISEQDGTGYTKRLLLKKMATLFDAFGFISPYIIRIKIILHKLSISGLDWDGDLPGEYAVKVETWFDEVKELSSIQLSRCLKKKMHKRKKMPFTYF